MPFKQFDRSLLNLKPLAERQHDIRHDVMIRPGMPTSFEHPAIGTLAERIVRAREQNRTVLWMMGAHVIRSGNGPILARLMRDGFVTHFALNGAGAIHDFELAMIGATTESVAKYISSGQFGLWTESGKINDAVNEGARDGLGFGESVGRMIDRENFPYKEDSLLWNSYKMRIPTTVHVGPGCDIVHEHPNCDGGAIGATTYTDFLIYVQSILNLEGGVFCDIGNAVIGPELYLKALSMARNVARREGKRIEKFTTAVFDLLPLEGQDLFGQPSQNDPRFYFKPWKMILAQTVADGGESFYVAGEHKKTVPALAEKIIQAVPAGKSYFTGMNSYKIFDRSRLELKPIKERVPDFTQADMVDPNRLASLEHPSLDILADRIREARDRKSTVLWMLGAPVIHHGNAPALIRLMKGGFVNHFALNGAGAMQDFELAMVGGTMENFVKYVGEGQFGLWSEAGKINEAIREGARDGLGFGESLGRMIDRENFPYKENSLLWNAWKLRVPATVHVVFGCDSFHELPNFDGKATGETTYADFLIYTEAIQNLEGGVFCNFGSRTIGPEVYLKALSMTRNVAHRRGERIARFTTAVIDVLPLEGQDVHEAPPKSDPRYYFRPWKTILARTVADGGESYYVAGDDKVIVPALTQKIVKS